MRTLIALAALAASSNAFAAGCPGYDYFITGTGTLLTGTTTGAGNDTVQSCVEGGAEDVTAIWYGYTANSHEFSLAGSSYDTALEVRDGACTSLACNDDYYGLQSAITLTVAAYTYYYIDIGGFLSGNGAFQLTITDLGGGCADGDADGFCDYDDYCFGPGQFDSDGDGVCDGVDYCWGYGDYDSDGDAVCDWEDYCWGYGQYDSDGDFVCDGEDYCWGNGQYDTDGEGVCDGDDVCWGNDYTGDADFDGLCNDLDFTLYADTVYPSTAFGLYAYNAPAGARVFFLAGRSAGYTCHPSGAPCVGIAAPIVLGSAYADGAGYATLTRNGPPNVPADVYLQAAELSTPNSTNLIVQ